MIIDCISDPHGNYPELEGGDLLIVAGDLTKRDTREEFYNFAKWMRNQDYEDRIVIAGNHDTWLTDEEEAWYIENWIDTGEFEYLCDDGTELENGMKIWGSPWTLKFPRQNPRAMAFCVDTEEELAEKWALIPSDVDILVTHSPPFGIMDTIDGIVEGHTIDLHKGSKSLHELLYQERIRPKLHIFGHIHEGYGHIPKMMDFPGVQFVNASLVNDHYEPVNKPIRVVL